MNSEILQQNLIYTANVQRGRRLEYLTIGWNSLEAVAAVAAGLMAGSIALVGFGIDSVIEVSSGAILLWRLFSGEHREQLALKLVGISFLALPLISVSMSSNLCGFLNCPKKAMSESPSPRFRPSLCRF